MCSPAPSIPVNLFHLRSETRNSCPDFKGQNYKASFRTRSSAKGPRKKIYRAYLEGQGPRQGERAVVKLFRQAPGTEDMCDAEIAKHVLARKFARKFNKMVPHETDKIRFTLPLKSTVEQYGIGTYLHHHSRHLDTQEWVLIEENLVHREHGDDHDEHPEFKVFLKKNGERFSGKDPTSLDAFLHFTYNESGHKFVMCGFQGIHEEGRGYTLTTPCLHSLHKLFGVTDKGRHGLRSVFDKHKCNNLCYRWARPRDHLDPLDIQHMGLGSDEDLSSTEETMTARVDSTVHFGAHSSSNEDSPVRDSTVTVLNGHSSGSSSSDNKSQSSSLDGKSQASEKSDATSGVDN